MRIFLRIYPLFEIDTRAKSFSILGNRQWGREMPSIDRIKEEIGWLKVPFGLLAVVDASLLGWLAQSYTKANPVLLAAASAAAIVVTSGIFQINRIAYRLIDDLEGN